MNRFKPELTTEEELVFIQKLFFLCMKDELYFGTNDIGEYYFYGYDADINSFIYTDSDIENRVAEIISTTSAKKRTSEDKGFLGN